jgi:hypothetical protein
MITLPRPTREVVHQPQPTVPLNRPGLGEVLYRRMKHAEAIPSRVSGNVRCGCWVRRDSKSSMRRSGTRSARRHPRLGRARPAARRQGFGFVELLAFLG